MTVVRIIAGFPVLYSYDNGHTMTEHDDGEYYDVPPHVADGMLARGWAQLVQPPPDGQPHQPHQPHEAPPPRPPVREPERRMPQPDDDDEAEQAPRREPDDDDERREPDELRADRKRR